MGGKFKVATQYGMMEFEEAKELVYELWLSGKEKNLSNKVRFGLYVQNNLKIDLLNSICGSHTTYVHIYPIRISNTQNQIQATAV